MLELPVLSIAIEAARPLVAGRLCAHPRIRLRGAGVERQWLTEPAGAEVQQGSEMLQRLGGRSERPDPRDRDVVSSPSPDRCCLERTPGIRRSQREQAKPRERRHRARARVEDQIRNDKDTGLANLPFRDFELNAVWLELVLIAHDLIAWTQALALSGELASCEPKRLRYRLLHVAGRLAFSGRRAKLRLAATWPWATDLAAAFARLKALPVLAG